MARDTSTIVQSLVRKLPTGVALGFRGGVLDALFQAAASEIADVEAKAEQLMLETDPRTADALLPDFERVLGPDPCGRDLAPLTLPERQRLAHQRWTAGGGQSIPYYLSIADKLGITITIEDYWPSKANFMRAGQRLRPDGVQLIWRVQLPAGSSNAALINTECELRRLAPAHTQIVVQIAGEAP